MRGKSKVINFNLASYPIDNTCATLLSNLPILHHFPRINKEQKWVFLLKVGLNSCLIYKNVKSNFDVMWKFYQWVIYKYFYNFFLILRSLVFLMNFSNPIHPFLFLKWALLSPHQLNLRPLLSLLELDYTHDDELY